MRSIMLYYIQLILINTHIEQGTTFKDGSDQISTQVIKGVDNAWCQVCESTIICLQWLLTVFHMTYYLRKLKN